MKRTEDIELDLAKIMNAWNIRPVTVEHHDGL